MTNLQTLQKLATEIEFNPEQIELCDERVNYVAELNKVCYELMETRDLLWNVIIQECAGPDNTIIDSGLRVHQEAIDYFKEIGWLSPAGQIWKEMKV